jgi:hypothetical protein
VGILVNAGGGIAICTGSLIAPNLVLTAHHCVADGLTQNLACNPNSFGNPYPVTAFRITTSYNAAATYFNNGSFPSVNNSTWFGARNVWVPNNDICGGDMATLELSSPITGVCPIVPRVDQPVTNGEAYRAVGFGITSPRGQTAGTRYTVSGLSVLCAGNCGPDMHPTLEWEGGTTASKGTCEGDSGGPALDASGRVIGTVSRGPAYACNDTVYESVYGQAAWVKARALQAATDGNYPAAGWVTGGATSDVANSYCPDGGTGGGTGAGGGTGGGGTGTGGGSGSGACTDPALTCLDASGQGDYACVDDRNGQPAFPANAQPCQRSSQCPSGFSCWGSPSSSTGYCLQDCSPVSTGGGAGGGSGGGTATGGGMGGGSGGGADDGRWHGWRLRRRRGRR